MDALSPRRDLTRTGLAVSRSGLQGRRKGRMWRGEILVGLAKSAFAAATPARTDGSGVEPREAHMLAWLLWQLERIQRIHAVAGMLISEFGVEAEAEARRREREANSAGTAREWERVVSVVARRTPKRAALEAATDQTLEFGSVAEPVWIASDRPQEFRIQFVCGAHDCSPPNLTEKHIQAADASAAIVAAANTEWPPQTIGLRILDREGREVFAREKAQRR